MRKKLPTLQEIINRTYKVTYKKIDSSHTRARPKTLANAHET